ncbi:MAG: hypothetical protein ACI9QN_002515 [Arcticibacterium sp.]|jgi:hypothetical protein
MKKVILSLVLVFTVFSLSAQSNNYEKTMAELVAQIEQVIPPNLHQPLTNKMERIAATETEQWLPNYWVAFCYTSDSFKKGNPAERDQLLDIADEYMKKAELLAKEKNSEIAVLKAQMASARMSIDPMNRFQKYGGIFQNALTSAIDYDSGNPRAYYLLATNAYFTPENFGGGHAKAKPLFETALEKFNNFKSESKMHPNWGFYESTYFLSEINK